MLVPPTVRVLLLLKSVAPIGQSTVLPADRRNIVRLSALGRGVVKIAVEIEPDAGVGASSGSRRRSRYRAQAPEPMTGRRLNPRE